MSLPDILENRLSLPMIAAPMFLVSGPEMVINCCRAGIVGSFPALNQRSTGGYEAWLQTINAALTPQDSPFAVNLIVHRTNPRLMPDLELTVKYRVPIVITSLGAASEVVDAVHSYGGLVYHDVINTRFAQKALDAGVDGLIAVCAGAGGHAGTYNPFAFISELKEMTDKTIIASGCISNGQSVLAAQAAGADLAYVGTRLIATSESIASPEYKDMLLTSSAADIIYTPKISGVSASFLKPSIDAAGINLDELETPDLNTSKEDEAKAWKDVWSAGQGVGGVHAIQSVAEVVAQFKTEYRQALDGLNSLAARWR